MSYVVESVVQQHAEEAAFLWHMRSQAVLEPDFSLSDLAALDGRVEAHLDGLRIAGEAGWEIVKAELAWEEPGETFAAAVLAFESGDPLRIEEALSVAAGSIELARGAISALGWIPSAVARDHAEQLLRSADSIRRRGGTAGLSVHRQNPGQILARLVAEQDSIVRSRALKAAGELGRTDLLGHCHAALEEDDEEIRFWAAWSAAILGSTEAGLRVLYGLALDGCTWADRAADLLARRMPAPRVLAWQRQLAGDGERVRLACRLAGTLGDPTVVPWLIEMMAVDAVARPAGEAFSMITGLDLAYEDLERDWPEGFEAGPTEDPDDEDVELDADEDLPWPDPAAVQRWWATNGGRLARGTRYLLGEPITPANLERVLRTGMQRQRAAAALELVLLRPGQPLFEVRARGDLQRRVLGL